MADTELTSYLLPGSTPASQPIADYYTDLGPFVTPWRVLGQESAKPTGAVSVDYYTDFGPFVLPWRKRGQESNKIPNYLLAGSTGYYSYTGQNALLYKSVHSYFFLAAPANYIYEGASSHEDNTSTEAAATYTYAGGAAGLVKNAGIYSSISPATGAYSYAGQTASFFLNTVAHYTLPLETTAYAYTGSAATLVSHVLHYYTLPAGAGSYAYSGSAAKIVRKHIGVAGYLLTTSTRTILGPKRVDQIVSPGFDFSPWMVASDVLSGPSVTISVWSGVDPNPQAMLAGMVLQGNIVYVALQEGIPGVIYQVLVQAIGSLSGTLEHAAYLAVLPASL